MTDVNNLEPGDFAKLRISGAEVQIIERREHPTNGITMYDVRAQNQSLYTVHSFELE